MTIHLLAPKDKDTWPDAWQFCFQTLNKLPVSKKIWYDEDIDQLLKNDDEDFYNNFLNKLPNIYKFDYVRYHILQYEGGIYMDMDIEIVQNFLPFLKPEKIYIMEGTNGDILENSLIVGESNKIDGQLWGDVKKMARNRIIQNFDKCSHPFNAVKITGPGLLSEFFLKYGNNYNIGLEILGYQQFNNMLNDISFTKHHYTSVWGDGTMNDKKMI